MIYMLLVEVVGEELENISFKSIVINRLLIGIEKLTIMPLIDEKHGTNQMLWVW